MIFISKTVEIDMGHRVTNHGGKCRHLHGHRYKIELFATAPELIQSGPSEGMLIDFGFLKEILDVVVCQPFDHVLVLWMKDPIIEEYYSEGMFKGRAYSIIEKHRNLDKVLVFDRVPTAENLAQMWLDLCIHELELRQQSESLPNGLTIDAITVWETPTSKVHIDN